jgi:hypothetical protein
MRPCLLTAPTTEDFVAAAMEAADPGYLEDYAAATIEPEKERYAHHGYFEVIGSHGGHYRIHRGVAGNITWLHPDGKVSAVTRAAVGPALRHDRPAIDSA